MQSGYQMGIAPIDLQTLYTQLDKVSKTHGSQAQTLQVQSALQDVEKAKKQQEENEKIASTNMAEEDDTQKVKDRQYHQNNSKNQHKSNPDETQEESEPERKKVAFQDPNLGQHIDVIG